MIFSVLFISSAMESRITLRELIHSHLAIIRYYIMTKTSVTSRIMACTDLAILIKFNAHELVKLVSADYRLFYSMKYISFHNINDKINGIPEVKEWDYQ